MRCSWEGQHPLHKVKRLFSLARWWMWCLWTSIAPFSILFNSHLLFFSIFLHSVTFLVHFPRAHRLMLRSYHSLSLSFSPICCLCLSHRESIVIDFIFASTSLSVSLSSSLQWISWRWPVGWARGCNTGHGSCLSYPLVSCVAASGAACLSFCPPSVDGLSS